MANTYSQIHLQFIFSPKYRASLIHPDWETDLYKHITGITKNNNHKLLSINGMTDHLHMLVGFNTTQSVADFMQDVKEDSSQWINKNNFCKAEFTWQSGYGVFSYAKSQIPKVTEYIEHQKIHHQKMTFLDEYRLFLKKFEVDFKDSYIFKNPQ